NDRRFTYQAISIPDLPGSPMSHRSKSMRWSSQDSINCSAESAVITKSKRGEASKNTRSESSITRLSSIIASVFLSDSMYVFLQCYKSRGSTDTFPHPKG